MANIIQRLTYMIEAQDRSQAAFEGFRHSVARTQQKVSQLSVADKKAWKQGMQQAGMRTYKTKQNLDLQKVRMENTKHLINKNKILINQQSRLAKQTTRFKFQYLGVMFAGMALMRYTGQFMKSAFTAYTAAFEQTSELEKITNKAAAAWKFFQFRLMDALAQSALFKNLVDVLIRVLEWFANLDEEIRMGLVVGMGLLFVAATFMFVGGQLALGINSIKLMFLDWGANAGVATTQTKALTTQSSKLAGLLKVGFSFYLIYKGFKDFSEDGLRGAIDEVLALVLVWTAGVGWGIGFYLIFKGIEWLLGKTVGEQIDEVMEGIEYKKQFFPADIFKWEGQEGLFKKAVNWFTGLFDSSKKTKDEMELLNDVFKTGGGYVSAYTLEVENLDKKLTKESLVPSYEFLNKAMEITKGFMSFFIESIPILTDRLVMETEAHYANASSIRSEASAYRELAEARREAYGEFEEPDMPT